MNRMSEPEISTSEVDRISSLSDNSLIRILSSLPIKEAFATSILSKRWSHPWCFVPNLDFSDIKWEHQDAFVYSVLRSRKAAGNHSINSFILNIGHYSPRLRDLVVGNWKTVTPELPTSILACTTLVVLKLGSFDMSADFNLNMIRLSSLKTLHLRHVIFKHDKDLMMILEKCPVLEDLQLFNIRFDGKGNYCCKSSENLGKLNRVDITDCYFYIPMKALSNVEFLRFQLSEDYHPYDFPTFHNLTHLVLNYYCDIAVQLIKHCPKLQNLEFYQGYLPPNDFPRLHNLTHLVLKLNYDWDIVVQVLLHCPELQNIELYQTQSRYDWVDEKNWVHPKFVPGCLSSNLTTCIMRNFAFEGLQCNHIMLAKFILENARVLETMSIWCYRKQSKIKSVLSQCPRASATCQLSIY